MARQSASANASKSKKPSSAKARASAPAGRKAPLRGKAAAAEEARLLDERTRHDIVGVVFAVLAAVLLVAAVLPTDAIVTSFLSTALHLTLGLGAYLLPFLLLAIGVSFLVRFDRERVPARVAVGLALVFFAVLVLLALFTPTPDPHDLSALFDHEQLAARGGYVGAGVAWVGLTLFGQVVSSVIMAGVILAGLAVVGFSLSKLIERVREKRAEREGEDVLDAPPFARVRRGQDLAAEGGDAALVKPAHPLADAAATKALPRTGERRRPRRASAPLGASGVAAAAGTAAPTAAFEPLPPLEGEPAPLTRKLGRKHAGEGVEKEKPAARPRGKKADAVDAPGEERGDYVVPPLSMLAANVASPKDKATDSELHDTAACLQETLESFSHLWPRWWAGSPAPR